MKKSTTCTVILIVILSIAFCVANRDFIAKAIGTYIVDLEASKEALPLFGEYICPDLDSCLTINEHEIYIISSDFKAKVHVDFHGRLLWGDGVIAFYSWDQLDNVIEIRFEQPPSGVSKDITYVFVSQDRS